VQLVADRFLVDDRNVVTDLATGARVTLIVTNAGAERDQARWAARCERFAQVRQCAIAPLDDYGVLGGRQGVAQRFEAWRCGARPSKFTSAGARAALIARQHLEASGLTAGQMDADAVRSAGTGGRMVVLPDADAGYEMPIAPAKESPVVTEPCALGLWLVPPDCTSAIAEVFADTAAPGPRVVSVFGVAGAGLGDSLRHIARAARAHGYLPVATGPFHAEAGDAVMGRSVVIISRDNLDLAWRQLVHWSVHTQTPPMLIVAGERELPSTHTVRLPRLSRDRLIESVIPRALSPKLRRRVELAADHSNGLPGRFASLLWRESSIDPRQLPRSSSRAAEHAPEYGGSVVLAEGGAVEGDVAAPALRLPAAALASSEQRTAPWASRREVAALRQRMDLAIAILARGRHAAGDRMMRQVVGGLARREDWSHAARAGLVLGRSLLGRGRAAPARKLLADAHAAAMRAGDTPLLIDIAIAQGVSATDLLQLDAAQTALQATVAAAEGIGDLARMHDAVIALARCLFWCGRFDAAMALLDRREVADSRGAAAVHIAALRSRVAVGTGNAAAARASVSRAERLAADANDPGLVAVAAYASAFAHLAVGDGAAVDRDVSLCLRAAHSARQTLLAVCARLLAAENLRRGGRRAAATAVVARIGKIARDRLPPIVSARHALLADLLSSASPPQVVKRHVDATGLKALALYAGSPSESGAVLRSVNDIVDILGCCHAADDDAAVLATLCGWLRTRLGAVGIAFFVPEHDVMVPVAADGGRIDPSLGHRLMTVGQSVAPHQADARIEGGVAVRYGGRIVGALAARWLLGIAVDTSSAVVLLTTAATAAGPALAGLIARRTETRGVVSTELLGSSAQMEEVRRAVERAARAPFAALIEGESGSGKELVARAMHRRSPRRDRPFCALNCAALPDDLVESELFGHARGAFTGAVAERPGVFEQAHTGTLFLDEIGELSMRAQAKVLRTIQEGELRRLGENVARHVDVRLVTATNRDLRHEVAAGRFRLDLLYRLDVLRIVVPPLRDRRDDVPLLAEHFWRESTARVGSRAALGAATLAALARYDWPGNVRELQNVLASLAVRSPKRGVVSPTALPSHFDGARADESWRLHEARRTFDARFIRAALARSGGHLSRAAEELGVSRQGLTKLMVRLGIAETS
jgi:DNA-binding NtrC family response regulator